MRLEMGWKVHFKARFLAFLAARLYKLLLQIRFATPT